MAHEAEREPMSLFFEHHANYESYFFDEAVRVRNTWETEFHTSFLQLSGPGRQGSPNKNFENRLVELRSENLPKLNDRQLVRASAGYRFLGDFLDRFWTCHFIEHYPYKVRDESPLAQLTGRDKGRTIIEDGERDIWRQRKILELILFNRIINEMNDSTREIVELIKKKLGAEAGRLSLVNLKIDRYFKTSLEWEALSQILEAMQADFTAIMDNITDWEGRERDRQQEQPRWTTRDERKCRTTINKLLVLNRRSLRELRGYQATVRSLKTSLATTQERIRNELSLRGNENIQYFTYATVFFLPLGFAASIFSMQAAPTNVVLRSMIICAIIAIVITVLFLYMAQAAWKAVKGAVKAIKRGIKSRILPHLRKGHHAKPKGDKKGEEDDQKPVSSKKSKRNSRGSLDSLV
jgi:hypothetical protein